MLGIEKIINGGFDEDASWDKGQGAAIDDGLVILLSAAGIDQEIELVAGRTYEVKITTSGNFQPWGPGSVYQPTLTVLLGNASKVIMTATEATFWLTPTSVTSSLIQIGATDVQYPGDYAIYVDDVSVKEILPPSITAVTEAGGVVTLTVGATGTVNVYSRAAGASLWTLSAQEQAAGDIAISGLTKGMAHEFFVFEYYDDAYSPPSNIASIYLHDSTLPTISEVEAWAVGILNGLSVFKTVEVWKHQIAAERGGLTKFDALAPFAFVGETPTNPQREGAMSLDRKLRLTVLIGQKSAEDGLARVGGDANVGTVELRSLVIAAMDGQHPGGSVDCDDFYYTGCTEIVDAARMHAVEMDFEAKWMG